jgi:hypothetical protein
MHLVRYRVRQTEITDDPVGQVSKIVGGLFDTREAAEAAARVAERDHARADVEVIDEDGEVVPRLDP